MISPINLTNAPFHLPATPVAMEASHWLPYQSMTAVGDTFQRTSPVVKKPSLAQQLLRVASSWTP